jgi:hypothetical protein
MGLSGTSLFFRDRAGTRFSLRGKQKEVQNPTTKTGEGKRP